MVARIDSKDKTIAIEEQVTIDELVKFLKFVDPTGWKQWKVNTNVKFEITSTPIVIREREYPITYMSTGPANPPYPNQPWAGTPIDSNTSAQFVDFQTH